jgi:two-component system response regulator NreC
MKTISLMLVDDHDVVRTGLKSFLESQKDLQVVAEASTGEQAIERALQTRPDIVLMDITMPGIDGMQATRQLKKLVPDSQVLALTVHADKQYFMEMLSAGASGYLTKQSAADELVEAIHAVAAGNIYLQPALARWLLEDYQRLTQSSPSASAASARDKTGIGLDALSPRERQVLEFVAQGLTNQQIGTQLTLSPKTVARHRERIMNKLNLHSRTELVKFALRTGLISLD